MGTWSLGSRPRGLGCSIASLRCQPTQQHPWGLRWVLGHGQLLPKTSGSPPQPLLLGDVGPCEGFQVEHEGFKPAAMVLLVCRAANHLHLINNLPVLQMLQEKS